MIPRRDILKAALALGAGSSALPALTPVDALGRHAQPMTGPEAETPDVPFEFDPVRFADDVASSLAGLLDHNSFAGAIAPVEEASYLRARAAFIQELPILQHVPASHPFHKMDEATWSWGINAYMQGIRDGAAYEHLRQSLIGPMKTCGTCHGIGSLGERSPYNMAGGPEVCPTCKGNGTVAIGAV